MRSIRIGSVIAPAAVVALAFSTAAWAQSTTDPSTAPQNQPTTQTSTPASTPAPAATTPTQTTPAAAQPAPGTTPVGGDQAAPPPVQTSTSATDQPAAEAQPCPTSSDSRTKVRPRLLLPAPRRLAAIARLLLLAQSRTRATMPRSIRIRSSSPAARWGRSSLAVSKM